ncbi:MAG: protein-glutamate O-methyltransferase CheR [Ruminococcus sp.]|nr:protein-glutamate O-methyltransferase CheR [Ruminococcus sp.]
MEGISDRDFNILTLFIKKGYGIDLNGKKFMVQSRLKNYVQDCGFRNYQEYFDVVFSDKSGREMANLINRLTTNHTYFMREAEHFEHFRHVFLPNADKTIKDHDLRIWSAGCSFGNEAYNLAMCMDEYFGFRQKSWDLKILATDISMNALRSASAGLYTSQALEDLPEGWKKKYFVETATGLYRVCDRIRNNVVFKYHNLMDDISFKKKFDLILCRNVMIYFDEEDRSKLCRKFYDATEDGGYLYIGHAENEPEGIPYVKEQPSIYRKEVQAE